MPAFMPDVSHPATNRRVILRERPLGIPRAVHFHLDEVPLGPVPPGRFRVRNIYLSVDPAQRGWANEDANYGRSYTSHTSHEMWYEVRHDRAR